MCNGPETKLSGKHYKVYETNVAFLTGPYRGRETPVKDAMRAAKAAQENPHLRGSFIFVPHLFSAATSNDQEAIDMSLNAIERLRPFACIIFDPHWDGYAKTYSVSAGMRIEIDHMVSVGRSRGYNGHWPTYSPSFYLTNGSRTVSIYRPVDFAAGISPDLRQVWRVDCEWKD